MIVLFLCTGNSCRSILERDPERMKMELDRIGATVF